MEFFSLTELNFKNGFSSSRVVINDMGPKIKTFN